MTITITPDMVLNAVMSLVFLFLFGFLVIRHEGTKVICACCALAILSGVIGYFIGVGMLSS